MVQRVAVIEQEGWLEDVGGADLLEFRLDLGAPIPERVPLPWICTVRDGVDVAAALQRGPTYCDMPWDWDIARWKREFPEVHFIASYHNFERVPDELEELWNLMRQEGVAYRKIAAWARSGEECLRLIEFGRSKDRCIAVAMGEWGELSRWWGSPWSYGRVLPGPSPIGQLRVEEMRSGKRLLGLMGDPVRQSVGPQFHNRWLPEEWAYVRARVGREELAACWQRLERMPFEGWSVTMPLKELIGPLLGLGPGPFNTLVKQGGTWRAYNTDGVAARRLLGDVAGKRVAILGRGGVAKGIGMALQDADVEYYGRGSRVGVYDVLVQATPVVDELLVDEVREGATVLEVVQQETALVRAARARGCRVIGGTQLFFEQALEQQKIWREVLQI